MCTGQKNSAGPVCKFQFFLRPAQGRNFGPKARDTNSQEERGTCGSRGEREENGEEVFCYSPDHGVWESVISSLSGVGAEPRPKTVSL